LRFVSSGDSTKRSDGFQRAASSGDFGLGAIRFLLAFAVVGAHFGKIPYHVPLSSLLAVQAFYIISGFLIALVWDNKYASRPNGLFLFYTNRAARIYWLYWVVLAISIAVAIGDQTLGWLFHHPSTRPGAL
jgi:peptidoglycan/LPS O-acetylase OafA/YrhL